MLGNVVVRWIAKIATYPRIVIDPQNPNIVYAAVLGNIYKPTEERGL